MRHGNSPERGPQSVSVYGGAVNKYGIIDLGLTDGGVELAKRRSDATGSSENIKHGGSSQRKRSWTDGEWRDGEQKRGKDVLHVAKMNRAKSLEGVGQEPTVYLLIPPSFVFDPPLADFALLADSL